MLADRPRVDMVFIPAELLIKAALITIRILARDYPRFVELWQKMIEGVRQVGGDEQKLLPKMTQLLDTYNEHNLTVRTERSAGLSNNINLALVGVVDGNLRDNWLGTFRVVSQQLLQGVAQSQYSVKPEKYLTIPHSHAALFLSNGDLVAATEVNRTHFIKIWHKDQNAQYQLVQELSTTHRFPISTLLLLPNDELLSSSQEGNGLRWCKNEDGRYELKQTLAHDAVIKSIALLPDNKMATASWDNTIKIWQLVNGEYQHQQTLQAHEEYITKIIRLDNDDLASASGEGKVKVWRRASNGDYGLIQTLKVGYPVRNLIMLDGNGFMSVCATGLKIWLRDQSDTYYLTQQIPGPCVDDGLAVLSRDAFALANRESIQIWQKATSRYELKQTLTGYPDRVAALGLFSSGALIGISFNSAKIWQQDEAGNYQCLQTIEERAGATIEVGSNNEYLCGGLGALIVWRFPQPALRVQEEMQDPLAEAKKFLAEYLNEADRIQEPARLFANHFPTQTAKIRELSTNAKSWSEIYEGLSAIEDPSRAVVALRAKVGSILPANAADLAIYCRDREEIIQRLSGLSLSSPSQ